MNGNQIDYGIIGKRLRDRREAIHMTQEALAEVVGVSTSFIGHLERGEKKPSVETVARLCAALSVPADYLLFGRAYPCDRARCALVRDIEALIHA